MYNLTTLSLLVLAAISSVFAQDVETDDIPQRCRSVCASVVSLSQGCDTNDNDDTARLNCICSDASASTQVPICNACLTEVENDPDNNVADIARSCSFASTTFASTLTSSSSNSAGTTTDPARTTDSQGSATDSTRTTDPARTSNALSSIASSASSDVSQVQSSVTSAVSSRASAASSQASAATESAAQQTGNAAAAITAGPMLGAGAGLVVAALAML